MSKYFEILENDDAELCRQKSKCNLNLLKDETEKIYTIFTYVDMSNGDRKRFKDWIVNLFLDGSECG